MQGRLVRASLFDRVFDRVLDAGIFLSGALMIFAMLSVSYEVGLRYFFKDSTNWVLEVNEIVLVYLTFLGAAWVLKGEGHVKIDFVANKLPPRQAAMLNFITSIICVVVTGVVVVAGTVITVDYYQNGIYPPSVMMIPSAVSVGIIPIGSLLLCIQFVRRSLRFLGQATSPRGTEPAEEAVETKS